MKDRTVEYFDDFFTGGTTSKTIGSLAWYFPSSGGFTGASNSYIASSVTHQGVLQLSTAATIGRSSAIILGQSENSLAPFNISRLESASACIKLGQTTNCVFRFGFGEDLTATNWGNEAVYWEYDSASSSSWVFKVRTGGSTVYSASSTIVANSTSWITLGIQAGTLKRFRCAYSQDTTVETKESTSDGPFSKLLIPAIQIGTSAAAAKTVAIDCFKLKYLNPPATLF